MIQVFFFLKKVIQSLSEFSHFRRMLEIHAYSPVKTGFLFSRNA